MKTAWLTLLCATGTLLSAPAWAQSDAEKPSLSKDSSMSTDKDTDKDSPRSLSATGRQSQPLRASKLTGAQVKDSSGSTIGQIEDVLVNPNSGRIDLAVISQSGSTSGSSTSGSSTSGSATTRSSTSTAGGQQLTAVPWQLLKPASSSQTSGSTSSTASGSSSFETEQPSFTLNVDQSKFRQAPTFTWTELRDQSSRQRVYSHFGVSAETSTGASESPSGSVRGEGSRKHMEIPPATSPDNP